LTSFEDEVFQQPAVLEKTLDFYVNQSDILKQARESFHVNGFNHITLTGMGSSLFPCILAQNFISKRGYETDIREAGELLNHQLLPKYPPTSLFILVSQSGESGEIVQLVEKLQQMRDPPEVWAITNDENSTLGQKAGLVFPTFAGEENSVTSKTYLATLLVQFLLSSALVSPILDLQAFQTVVTPVIEKSRELLTRKNDLVQKMMAHLGTSFSHLYFVARGCSLATAYQAALNFQEICRVPSQGISGGQFRHGPIEVIDQNFRAILLNSDRETAPLMDKLAQSISKRWGNGKVAVFTNIAAPDAQDPNILYAPQPINNEFLAPIGEIIPLQLFVIAQAKARGIQQPGKFRNTQKITKDV
jgi:glucosamine--fructose-6-phosphate aminotransferase (isomerizing)